MEFEGRDAVSIKDFTKGEIERILDVAEEMIPIAKGEKATDLLNGKVMASLFFEPSTRTRLSFETAMKRLGGKVIGFADSSTTSIQKGESLTDTVRMAESYSDVIVIRHPQEGSARLAAQFSKIPVINAGDGAGHHPTQCLLDLFTIRNEMGKIGDNKVILLGDLKYGRTVHSLAYALALFGAQMIFVAPQQLQMPKEVIDECEEMGIRPSTTTDLKEVIDEADVLYVTRIQRERFPDPEEYARVAGAYKVNREILTNAKEKMIIMHPLPRTMEISPEVDSTSHAAYFKQAFNGVPIRMALLALILGKIK